MAKAHLTARLCCRCQLKKQRGGGYAKNHAVLVVRRQSGRGSKLLYLYFQELENPERCPLRRSGTGTERNGDGGDVPTRRAGIHGAEWWSAVHIFTSHIVLCKLRDAGRSR